MYIGDFGNQRIRKVTVSTDTITTIAGSTSFGFSGDNGPATSAFLNSPWGVAVDTSGRVIVITLFITLGVVPSVIFSHPI